MKYKAIKIWTSINEKISFDCYRVALESTLRNLCSCIICLWRGNGTRRGGAREQGVEIRETYRVFVSRRRGSTWLKEKLRARGLCTERKGSRSRCNKYAIHESCAASIRQLFGCAASQEQCLLSDEATTGLWKTGNGEKTVFMRNVARYRYIERRRSFLQPVAAICRRYTSRVWRNIFVAVACNSIYLHFSCITLNSTLILYNVNFGNSVRQFCRLSSSLSIVHFRWLSHFNVIL